MKRGIFAALVVCFCSSFAWAQPATKSTEEPVRQVTLVTYNVLVDRVAVEARGAALLKLLKDSNADVIALQEVAPWFREAISRAEWTKAYRSVSGSDASPPASEFLVLSKFPVIGQRMDRLPGRQRRSVLVVQLRVNGRRMTIATVHLESPLEAGETRAAQLRQVFPLFRAADDAVFLGDFNFADGWKPETPQLDAKFVDLWSALRPNEPGYTWNMEVSPMARAGSFPNEKSGRIDRIFLRSDAWEPASIEIIGDKPVSAEKKDVFPSDHFGLRGVIRLKPTETN